MNLMDYVGHPINTQSMRPMQCHDNFPVLNHDVPFSVPTQIEYSNSHASNSFDVYRGDKTILTCVTSILPTPTLPPSSPASSSSSSSHGPSAPSSRLSDEQHFPKGANQNRHSTCFTARLVKLQKGKEGGENSKSGGGNGVHCSGTMLSTGSFEKRFKRVGAFHFV